MKKGYLIATIIIFAVEITALVLFSARGSDNTHDALAVNEVEQSVRAYWDDLEEHTNAAALDYVVIGSDGEVLYRTKTGLSESINAAIIHRDTILDVQADGGAVGKIIIHNSYDSVDADKRRVAAVFAAALVLQCAVCVGYTIFLERRIVKPFGKMKGFAERVAGGNLDIPLEMDRENLFGAFTESFDIMRSELKKARVAEAKANASKKELVAKLSHDIRTPVASIKAVSELGAATSPDEKTRGNYKQIILKADQINTLVWNLFSATLEELQQLTVSPADMPSTELRDMLISADYFHKAEIPDISEKLLFADKLRLQQVLDNIFANSYKYANTDITVKIYPEKEALAVEIEDSGGGVSAEELPTLTEKFKRGKNSEGIDGAGLGLYISDAFMRGMGGKMLIENGERGLKITVRAFQAAGQCSTFLKMSIWSCTRGISR